MDGAAEQVDKFMDWAAERNISVLMDIHTAIGSQNGFDNGGRAWQVKWLNETVFDHNDYEFGNWMGF